MDLSSLHSLFDGHPALEGPDDRLRGDRLRVTGLSGSSLSLFFTHAYRRYPRASLVILRDYEEAAFFYTDLLNLEGIEAPVWFLPPAWKRNILSGQEDSAGVILRTEVLTGLHTGAENPVIVTFPEAMAEKLSGRETLSEKLFTLHRGDRVGMGYLKEIFLRLDFEEVDFVQEPGQYAIRGGIVDIFSWASEFPARLDFFGDEIDSIRPVSLEDQLSAGKIESYTVAPNLQGCTGNTRSLPDCLPVGSVIWSNCFHYTAELLDKLVEEHETSPERGNDNPSPCLLTGSEFLGGLGPFSIVDLGAKQFVDTGDILSFHTSPQPLFHRNFGLLAENLHNYNEKGYQVFFLTTNPRQAERLTAIFRDIESSVSFSTIQGILHEGFVDHDLRKCFYTDHQVFDRYHKHRVRQSFSGRAAMSLREVHDLRPGDYIVHIDHGIGIFGGLEKIINKGKPQETVRLVYKDKDILYVSIHALHKISKYRGADGGAPKINKLGTPAWQNLKDRTRKKIKDIARDLVRLYAKRRIEGGFAFSADTYLQQELEASFMYEDTPDQLSATQAVKLGMEEPFPMDRLICGDVGFGKTEVAIRASFKAVTDSKQVAVLVPTTILALQHYNTFSGRLEDFPCNIDYVSRLKKPAQVKASLRKLEKGETDIIIGTHRLLGRDVKFLDLGLLVVDEEQKFGVAAKEKLKNLRVNVDTLTLTATPIPRTLQFSLMGARDLSVINTPPPNRHPIVTELHTLNEAVIREGIEHELGRNGQVFFIHNRIQNIQHVENMIRKTVPGVKTVVAHGQMEGSRLEKTMLDFIRGDYDVLVSTTIIEAGLDIPNANTIFINNAQNFGLSDLHQLRGRVGRSNRKAYCYLLAPPISTLTAEARRRLQAIEEFSDLGSGFHIAMQDLDIRGAGNLLGAEQSGFIADIGLETYQRILEEAVLELREEEFSDNTLYGEKKTESRAGGAWVNDCTIDTDLEILLPDTYVKNITERMHLYRELDNIENEDRMRAFEAGLKDRFGPVPEQAGELLNVVRLRWKAISLGFEKLILKNGSLAMHFVSNPLSPYFRSGVFSYILDFVQKNQRICRMKEGKDRLTLTFSGIDSIRKAMSLMERMSGPGI